jgi:polyisoprenoid-binding protein YceI
MAMDTAAPADSFTADPVHSSVTFSVSSMGISTFRGSFRKVKATVRLPNDRQASLTGSIATDSISIREPPEFRAHLLSDSFFAAEAYPEITWESTEVTLTENGEAVVIGNLTLRGVTQQVTARGRWAKPTIDPSGKWRAHLSLEATIDRRVFGMNWNQELPDGGEALGNEVTVSAELPLISTG